MMNYWDGGFTAALLCASIQVDAAEVRHIQLVKLASQLYYSEPDLSVRYEPRSSKRLKWYSTLHIIVARLKGKGSPSFRMNFDPTGLNTNKEFLMAMKEVFAEAMDWVHDRRQGTGRWVMTKRGWVRKSEGASAGEPTTACEPATASSGSA